MVSTLILAIDARKAKEGADQFRRATRDVGDAAGEASRKTRDLERSTEDTSKAEQRAAATARAVRDERGRFVSAQERATQEVRRGRDELGRFVKAQEDARRSSEKLSEQQRQSRAPVAPVSPIGRIDTSAAQSLVAELGPVGEQLASITARGQAATSALGALFGVSATGAAALVGVGAGFALIASSIQESIDKAKEFEVLQRRTLAILPRGEDPNKSSQAVLDTSKKYGLTLGDVSAANESIRQQVRDASEAEKVLDQVGRLARATGLSIAALAPSIADIISNYRKSAQEAESVVQLTFTGANQSGKKVDEYGRALAELGPTAQQTSTDLLQIAAALTSVSRELSPGQGADGIRRLLLAISDESDPINEKLTAIGVNLKRDADGSLNLARIVSEIGAKTRGEAGTITSIFGTRDAPVVFALIRGGAEESQRTVEALSQASEEFARVYGQQASSVTASNERMRASLEAFSVEVGNNMKAGMSLVEAQNAAAARRQEVDPQNPNIDRFIEQSSQRILSNAKYTGGIRLLQAGLARSLQEQGPQEVVRTFADSFEQQTVEAFTSATSKARSALESFKSSLELGQYPPLPLEIAIQTQPEDIQAAYQRLASISTQAPQKILLSPEDERAVSALEQATRSAASAARSRSAALDSEREAQDAATRATERAVDALQKRARAQAEADRDKAGTGLRDYIKSLQDEAELLSLDPIDREMKKAERSVQGFTDAYRDALIALGEDPQTVDLLVPDQTASIDQVRKLVEEIQRLHALQEQSPIERYGPFIPDTSAAAPAQIDPFGPEFDANVAEGQRRLEEIQASLRRERDMVGLSNDARERAIFLRDAEGAAIQAGVQDRAGLIESLSREFDEYQRLRDLGQLGQDMGRAVASGFEEARFQAKSFNDALRDIGREISQLAFRQFVTKPLTDSLGGLFSGLLSGGAGASAGGSDGIFARGGVFDRGELQRFELGGAFHRGSVVPFASGGIFDQPTYFPMSQGRTGLLGEAGPEAIMPLTRGADGKLGVRAESQPSKSVVNNTTHVSMTVVTQNADSFKKSSAQITRDLKKRL